ncbi:MAG: TonB-dependent receptor, partial [Paludibaculum sp.]
MPDEPDGGALPGVTITGYNVTGGSRPTGYISNRFQYSDVLSLTRGNHVLKLGADIRRLQYNVYSSNSPNRRHFLRQDLTTSTAGGSTPGATLWPTTCSAPSTPPAVRRTVNSPAFRNTTYNFFAQDEWKVTSRLHLSLGLRYEYAQRAYDVHNKIA